MSYKEKFSFKSPGFTSVGFYKENEIIGGVDNSHGGSIMLLDLKTRETSPLKTPLNVVFNITHSKSSYIIYIAGFKNGNNGIETQFIEYNLLTKRGKTLAKSEFEVLNSSFVLDDKNNIYTNLGTKSMIRIDLKTTKIKPFQTTTNQTKNILYKNDGIYTINENRSLSIWHPTTGKKLIDFYLFNDDEWVAISQDGVTAFGSPGAKEYISSN